MSSFFPIPPIPYWLWQRYLLLKDESIDVGVINGMNYRGAGVLAHILSGSTYGKVEISEYNNCTPPDYPDGVWFSVSAITELADYPGTSYANRVYLNSTNTPALTLSFQTSHSDWYQWDSTNYRIYNYASGSCQGASLYWTLEVTSSFDDSELCSGTNDDDKFGIKILGERWTGTPPAPSYSMLTSLGFFNYYLAGCSTQTVGDGTISHYKMITDESQMFNLTPPIYPSYLKLYALGIGPASSHTGVSSSTTFTLKYTNYPQFHIPPEYQT